MVDRSKGNYREVHSSEDEETFCNFNMELVRLQDNSFSQKFLDKMVHKHKDIAKYYRIYRRLMTTRLYTRTQKIAARMDEQAYYQFKDECKTLRAQIWVANGVEHKIKERLQLKNIECHVGCQERLSEEIQYLKTSIANMDSEIIRAKKAYVERQMNEVSDASYLHYMQKKHRQHLMIQNEYEHVLNKEGLCKSDNERLREELISVLHRRANFNQIYQNFVTELSSSRKYMIDAIGSILEAMDFSIEVYERMSKVQKRSQKENELRKVEMMAIQRKIASDMTAQDFIQCKGKPRPLADLEPREYRRRDKFRTKHLRKINLYRKVLDKVHDFLRVNNIAKIVQIYQIHESQYYMYFNYANEISYRITLLNKRLNGVYEAISDLRATADENIRNQVDIIKQLEKQVLDKQASNDYLQSMAIQNDELLKKQFRDFDSVCNMFDVNTSEFKQLLGDNTHINLINFRKYLIRIEERVKEMVASIYIVERLGETDEPYTVQGISKICDPQTKIDEIVLTQQCPECAEGEAFNVDDTKGELRILTMKETRKRLHDKVVQPEMQYLLHSLSTCRLPRSRVLAARRDNP